MNTPEKKIETKPEKSEVKPVQAAEPQINILRSEIDARIMDHMRSQPKTLEDVESVVITEPKEAINRMSLPDEIKSYENKFAFCWIYKDRAGRAIGEACTLYHWVLCNRTHFPEVAEKSPHIFSANGAIERGDNILAFRTKEIDERMRKAPGIESAQRIKKFIGAKSNSDPAFYAPQSDEFEVDEKTGQRKKVSVVGL